MARLFKTEKTLKEGEVFNKWLKNRLINNNKNVLCLSGDTKLFGQDKTIEELYNSNNILIDTYSITQAPKGKLTGGCYYPIRSKSKIIFSGMKEVYEIELDNGEKVQATLEHKFFVYRKGKRIEITLKELKEGDNLICYPKDYLTKYYNKTKERTKKVTRNKYNPKKICKKCNSLFFIELGQGNKTKEYCNNCSKELGRDYRLKKTKEGNWYEWEDNLLRNFYYDMPKEKLMELLPLRKTWSSIIHRAIRLKVNRNPILQWKDNAFTTQNNPMNSLDIRKKASCSQQGINISEWDGFKSYEPYTYEFNKTFKDLVRLRDNFCCLNCGISEQKHIILLGKKLAIHHIDYIKNNTYLTNCCTLCNSCNTLANKNRDEWKEYYQNKLSNLYKYEYEVENVSLKN